MLICSAGVANSANCLRDRQPGLAGRDHSRDGRLPGQRFTADQQCAFFWGKGYKEDAVGAGKQLMVNLFKFFLCCDIVVHRSELLSREIASRMTERVGK